MYHHHLLTQEEGETIKLIYEKQKISPTKGDWYELSLKDFDFIEEKIDDDKIKMLTKAEFKKKIKMLVKKAALKYLNKEKDGHKKVKNIDYNSLNIQPYLTSKLFTREERNLMYSLRSNCHPAKNNFKRMNKNNLLCSLGCQNIEDQVHIFTQCPN